MMLNRRQFLQLGLGISGLSLSPWAPWLARAVAEHSPKNRHCILLWMTGGPTQTDTFDMKPGHANGGEFKEIETNAPGLRFSEHLPKLALQANDLAVIRSLSTKEGDHGRGTYLMRTGHQPGGPISYPTIGASLSKALAHGEAELPNFVSISPYQAFNRAAFGPGFLGPRFAPLTVGAVGNFQQAQQQNQQDGYAELGVDDLQNDAVDRDQQDARLELWRTLQTGFLKSHHSAAPVAHNTVYQRAVRMMRSEAAQAFDLSKEPAKVRDAYGRGRFGQGCLMARRLVEQRRAVHRSFARGRWRRLAGMGHASRQLQHCETALDRTGRRLGHADERVARTRPAGKHHDHLDGRVRPHARSSIGAGGRDHFPAAWSAVLAGGGMQGGQAFGRTSADGMTVEDKKVDVGDVLATLCRALGVDPNTQNIAEMGRPIRIAEGKPIDDLLA